ncbi:MAG: hypothetical protein WD939_02850 [Dehalococcoidia bacterium]
MSEPAEEARTAAEQAPAWQDALDELERVLEDAHSAIGSLRDALSSQNEAPFELTKAAPREDPVELAGPRLLAGDAEEQDEPPGEAEVALPTDDAAKDEGTGPDQAVLSPADDSARLSAFERVWERIERERMERGSEDSGEPAEPRETQEAGETNEPSEKPRGLDLLPKQYLMTVEDRENQVDLTSVHRALLSLADQQDVSLVSFANGTPVISMRTAGELDLGQLASVVASGTNRACEVIEQGSGKLFLRLRAPKDGDGDRG